MVSISWAFVFVSHKAKGFLYFFPLTVFLERKTVGYRSVHRVGPSLLLNWQKIYLRRVKATPTKSGLFGLRKDLQQHKRRPNNLFVSDRFEWILQRGILVLISDASFSCNSPLTILAKPPAAVLIKHCEPISRRKGRNDSLVWWHVVLHREEPISSSWMHPFFLIESLP